MLEFLLKSKVKIGPFEATGAHGFIVIALIVVGVIWFSSDLSPFFLPANE